MCCGLGLRTGAVLMEGQDKSYIVSRVVWGEDLGGKIWLFTVFFGKRDIGRWRREGGTGDWCLDFEGWVLRREKLGSLSLERHVDEIFLVDCCACGFFFERVGRYYRDGLWYIGINYHSAELTNRECWSSLLYCPFFYLIFKIIICVDYYHNWASAGILLGKLKLFYEYFNL